MPQDNYALVQNSSNNLLDMSAVQLEETLRMLAQAQENNIREVSQSEMQNLQVLEYGNSELDYNARQNNGFSQDVESLPILSFQFHSRNMNIRIHPRSENFMPRMRQARSTRREL